MQRPTIDTQRLILRPFRLSDAPAVQRLAGDPAIADTTRSVPHPYGDGMAEAWIVTHEPAFEAGVLVSFAVVLRENQELAGTVSLTIDGSSKVAELGYWIGVDFWNSGYCTEAVMAVVDFGFATLRLERIFAHHLARNPASGRVMQKAGMSFGGTSADLSGKRDKEEELRLYGLSRKNWVRARPD